MNRINFNAAAGLGLMAALFGQATPAAAQAREDVTPPSDAQSLACLQRPADQPVFPPRATYERSSAWVRVGLRFSTPTAPPEVEILANTMREDQLDTVQRYVKRYRLPCLQASDGSVQAVQEFKFNNSELAPLPVPPDRPRATPSCIVQPTERISINQLVPSRQIEHVVLTMAFTPSTSGTPAAPQVKVLYTDASSEVLRSVTEWAAQSRMPCLTGESAAAQGPVVLRQSFNFRPYGHRGYTFKDARFPLPKFLGMVKDLEGLKADFDFDTMNCPFKVNYTVYGPRLPNEVTAGRPVNPNRVPFLKWLAARDLNFKSDKMANDLFGEIVQIDVPCGKLALGDETTTTSSL